MENHQQIRSYFEEVVNPEFQNLIASIIKYRPQDILEYCLQHFKDDKKKSNFSNQNCDSDDDDIHIQMTHQQFQSYRALRIAKNNRKARYGVSSQANGNLGQRKPINLRKIAIKSEKTQMKILFFFMNSFMFKDFNEEQKKLIIESMTSVLTKQDQLIVKEGDFGDCMYFIQEGLFQCSQKDKSSSNSKFLRNYQSGDIFGELSILYNVKRSATVISKTQGSLYILSRQVYRHIKKLSIVKKRSLYLQAIKKVNIFENIDKDELQKICDLLTQVTYEPQSYVIVEGDVGTKFYIVLQGILITKKGQDETMLRCFKQGDYFGQIALVKDQPRKASVISITKSTLVYLTQDVFKRVINKQKVKNQIDQKYENNIKMVARKKRFQRER